MAFHSEYPPIGKKLLTIFQAADLMQVSRRTIYNWISSGRIDYCRTASETIRVIEDSLFSKVDKEPLNSKKLVLLSK